MGQVVAVLARDRERGTELQFTLFFPIVPWFKMRPDIFAESVQID
jgi:hypothetical protein